MLTMATLLATNRLLPSCHRLGVQTINLVDDYSISACGATLNSNLASSKSFQVHFVALQDIYFPARRQSVLSTQLYARARAFWVAECLDPVVHTAE